MMLRTGPYGIIRNGSKEIRLSRYESRLLEVLSNGKVNSHEDITKYIYKDNKKHAPNAVVSIKKRLLNKIDLNIQNMYGQGLMLTDKVYIM